MKLVPIDPALFPEFREGRRGRVSYPLLKTFLETSTPLVMLDRTGMQQSLQSLTSSLGAYIRSHNLPIKLLTRSGQIYLARTDVDPETKKVKETKSIDEYRIPPEAAYTATTAAIAAATPITATEVGKRFEAEKHKAGK